MKIVLDYGALRPGADLAPLDVPDNYDACGEKLRRYLKDEGVTVAFMMISGGRFLDRNRFEEMKEEEVVAVIPVMGGG